MALFKIIHRESLVGVYYVEADSKEEALEEWECMINRNEVDFSDMDLVDSDDTVFRAE